MAKDELAIVLDGVLEDAKKSLLAPARKLFETKANALKKESGLKDLLAKKTRLEAKVKKGQDDLRELNIEIRAVEASTVVDRYSLTEEGIVIYELAEVLSAGPGRGYSTVTHANFEATKSLMKTKEVKNYLSLRELVKNTKDIYRLAITKKEKRNIILKFQNKDWRSVGVKLPELPHLADFEIVNGVIKLSTVPALPMCAEGDEE